jgi:hypothetical protein
MSTTFASTTHELYLQNDAVQYDIPILFQGGMDTEECEIYYNLIEAQQSGGVYRHSRQLCRRVLSHDGLSSCTTSAAPTSILKKSRYTKPTDDCSRPCLVRRFSFSEKGEHKSELPLIGTLRRSNSLRKLDTRHVAFTEMIRVVTIYPIDEMPYDVRHNLWLSPDELVISMHEAAIEKMEEELAKRKQEEKRMDALVERRNSDTSVIIEGGKNAYESEFEKHYPRVVSRVA